MFAVVFGWLPSFHIALAGMRPALLQVCTGVWPDISDQHRQEHGQSPNRKNFTSTDMEMLDKQTILLGGCL
eukprot:8664989-Prorocentrum_lima.AAC.1